MYVIQAAKGLTPVTHNRRPVGDWCKTSGTQKIVNSLFEVANSCQQFLSRFLSVSSNLFKSFSRQSVDGAHNLPLGYFSYCCPDHSFTVTDNWETLDRLLCQCCSHSLCAFMIMNEHIFFTKFLNIVLQVLHKLWQHSLYSC